uniref:Uncharacterized protein n=1 Tax=Oryza nivara TaxID=4536 RepID=A0A0E0I940_ORYNI
MSRRNSQEPEHGGAEEEDRLVAAGDGEAYVATWVVNDISDKVLELVLLRLHSDPPPASSAPRPVFLRRFRVHHGPDLVGHYHAVGGAVSHAAFVHVSRPVLVYGCRLSLDFVPDTASWTIAETPTAAAALMASSSASHLRGATRWSPSPRRR